jgi:hypothetical protein
MKVITHYVETKCSTHEIIELQCEPSRFLDIVRDNFHETFSIFYHNLYI